MAASCAHESSADAARSSPGVRVLESAIRGRPCALGRGAPRSFHAAAFCQRGTSSEVLALLRRSGFNFEDEWFASHLEFRFPKVGSIVADGIELELRRALEPWNVLAEETVSGRTVRSVDSSLERMQVKVSGLPTESRYVVACNGRKVPLQPTADPGVMVAAVRYRARSLSASLHPTVPVHAPLRVRSHGSVDGTFDRSMCLSR